MACPGGCNINNEPIFVFWFSLNRIEGHKCECPVCFDGILTMLRSNQTGELLEYDSCVSCGQRFIYQDIDLVRNRYP